MGKFSGPLTLLWFLAIGALGLWSIFQTPHVFLMVNPYWALSFVFNQPYVAFLTMGAVILTMTGGRSTLRRYGTFWYRLPIRFSFRLLLYYHVCY